MSNESEENARLVTCRCQICNGAIEFDANELNGREEATVECPYCKMETVIYAPRTTSRPAQRVIAAGAPPVISKAYCRNCGKLVNPAAIACLSCGASPRSQNNFCWHCGERTTAVQVICVKCGVSLESQQFKTGTPETHNKLAAALLAIFLGALGIHKFYLGYTKEGVIMLAVSVIGALIIFPPFIMAIIGLIEGIMYMSDPHFEATHASKKKPWF
jgi:TM2 domain-containing membrane protein YozV